MKKITIVCMCILFLIFTQSSFAGVSFTAGVFDFCPIPSGAQPYTVEVTSGQFAVLVTVTGGTISNARLNNQDCSK